LSTILEPGQIEAAASAPPFLHLPPANLFALRAARLDTLAAGHALGDYLRLIASLCRIQQSLLDEPLQAAWSHWLLSLPDAALKPGDNLCQCPACGSPAMAGVIRHRGKFNGLRYLVCSLCACEWHAVRVKCIYCEQSKGLEYFNLEDDRHAAGKAPLRAECCPGCKVYLKQLYLECDADAEALSADLASLALDLRLDQEGYQRLAPNLMLAP